MTLFYHPDFDQLQLSEEEAQHAVRVLRLTSGDEIGLLDGKGSFATATITKADKRSCEFRILTTTFHEALKPAIHLALAPTKNADRIEWLLEKATEMGAASFSFFTSFHSERKNLNTERLEKIVISAMKQSKGFWLPEIKALQRFPDFIKATCALPYRKLICHQEEGKSKEYDSVISTKEETLVLIGPEGDFSLEEVALARENGFQPVTLGALRLRTETAGLAAVAGFHLKR